MRAPRLNIGIYADGSGAVDLYSELQACGHSVSRCAVLAEVHRFELVIIAVADEDLKKTAAEMAVFARRGQMFLHTSLYHGVQALDPVELAGCVVMAATPLSAELWVASAFDELGQTVVELVVGELGARVLMISDAQRPQVAASLSYLRSATEVAADAVSFLSTLLDSDIDPTQLWPVPFHLGTVIRDYAAFEDLGRKRAFRDLARRRAEIADAHDIELWALQEGQL